MNESIDREELLWEIGRVAREDGEEAGVESLLSAYRRGELSPQEAERVDRALAGSSALRRRLAEDGGVEAPKPSDAARRRALGGHLPGRTAIRPGWRLAAVLLVGILAGGVGYLAWPEPEPEGMRFAAFQVTVEALAERRSTADADASPGPRIVQPGTRVVIRVEPEGAASAETEFALYRSTGAALERIAPADGLEVDVHRGAARFVAFASDLVGPEPGARSVWVVAARAGDLPDLLNLGRGTPPTERLAAGGRRFVREQILVMQQ